MIKGLGEMDSGSALIITESSKLHEVTIDALSSFSQKNLPGVFTSLTKPSSFLRSELKKKNIPVSNVIFMESISNDPKKLLENVVFIPNMEDLAEIKGSIDTFLSTHECKKFLIIDSIDTLAMHNSTEEVINFIEKIMKRCSLYNATGVMVISQKDHYELLPKITSLFDKVFYT